MMPAGFFLPACYLGVHVFFCAVGGFFEVRVFGKGGERCVAEVCVSFIEVRWIDELNHGHFL